MRESRANRNIDILVTLGEQPLGLAYFALVREIAALFPEQKTDVISEAALKPGYLAAISKALYDV